MSHLPIGSRMRQWVQWFFGVLSLEKKSLERHIASEVAMRARHEDVLNTIGEISERLGRLENRFTSDHVPRPKQAVVYDWDQVQQQELAEMLANPPSEVA